MSTDQAHTFATALQSFEKDGDVEKFVSQTFADDVTLLRPESGQREDDAGGARTFWQQYTDQFQEIRSEFSRVVDAEVAVLEWTSTGKLSNGADISYSGVSLLDFDDAGRVTRFVTYYDSAPFTLTR